MRFIFYSPIAFEVWDYNNSVKKGIGGSETSHVEMAWRLAQRGHEVITYAPIKKSTKTDWRGTKWYPIEKANFKQDGVWILYRCPDVIDKFLPRKKTQQLWLMMQDWDYPNWTDKRIKNTDKIITLCKSHGIDVLRGHSAIVQTRNLWLSSNGVKIDLLEEIEKKKIKRDPLKIIYTSSPDRALRNNLKVFKKAQQLVPGLKMVAYYGFNNLDKLIKNNPTSYLAQNKKEMMDLFDTPGFTFGGRISQKKLYEEWFSSGIWLYCTNFNETSCISCMEAQAMGAIPVTNPVYALRENVKSGVFVEGDADNDELMQSRMAMEIVKLALNPKLQDEIRAEMMPVARKRFDWEVFVTQWELEAQSKRKEFEKQYEFPRQL